VELNSLTTEDFVRILKEPENALLKQYRALLASEGIEYRALLASEGIELEFTDEAIRAIAEMASYVNSKAENIGARRLHTILTTLLEDILYEAPDVPEKKIVVTEEYVRNTLKDIVEDEDLRKFIL